METSPRYDDKKSLSKYANEAPHKARDSYNNPLKDRIVIGQHNLVCECGLMLSRYGNPSMLSDDGIHLRGATGKMPTPSMWPPSWLGLGLPPPHRPIRLGRSSHQTPWTGEAVEAGVEQGLHCSRLGTQCSCLQELHLLPIPAPTPKLVFPTPGKLLVTSPLRDQSSESDIYTVSYTLQCDSGDSISDSYSIYSDTNDNISVTNDWGHSEAGANAGYDTYIDSSPLPILIVTGSPPLCTSPLVKS